MKRLLSLVFSAAGMFCVASAASAATTHYVDLNSPSPVSPYTSWATAATNIQDAVDSALSGELILVTNGVYQTGAVVVNGMTNRVAVTKPVTVQSVNGPAATAIVGYGPCGAAAVRCVYMASGAVLSGFALTNGATQTSGNALGAMTGGGVWCESASAVVTNCTLTGNSAYYYGGGAYFGTLNNCAVTGNSGMYGGGANSSTLQDCVLTGNSASSYGGGAYSGTLNNCALTGNSASLGGGAYSATLNNCALTGNSASSGGGAYSGALNNCTLMGNLASFGGGACTNTLNNCIVYYNTAGLSGDNYYAATLNYCCTTPLPSVGSGSFTAEPQLAGNWHLGATSPCRGAGNATYATGRDLDGEPWASPPSVGCDEYWSASVTGALNVAIQAAYTNVAVSFGASFVGRIDGRTSASRWDFGDGTVVSNRPYASHAWSAPGDYAVELRAYNSTYPGGVAATLAVHVVAQPVHYVALDSATPVAPYTSWATAATNIQDAVDAATVPGALVLVADGVYQTGAAAVYGMSNRVAVTKPVTVQSVNGPEVTTITGFRPAAVAVRCVYLTNGAVLAGFTLTNGDTQASGDSYKNQCGAGVWCESASAVVTNCILTGNWAFSYGGGAFSGTLNNCTLTNNWASISGGAAFSGTLSNCTLTDNGAASSGGGAYSGTLNNCTLTGNSASYGGGASYSALNNCTLADNSAAFGGGADHGTLNNCTLTANSSADYGGGADYATLNNCTLTGNSASDSGGGADHSTLNNCTLTCNSASGGLGGGADYCTLSNCTLCGNSASSGGGTSYGTLNNCTLTGNSASSDGGGAYLGTLNNCTLTDNSAGQYAGGAESAILNNCTLTGNSAGQYAGGTYSGTLNNCIVYFNTAWLHDDNYSGGTINYCCTTPLPGGSGNLAADPQLASASHLSATSPCRGVGRASYATGRDIDGELWASPPSVGCDEYWSGSVTGPLNVAAQAAYTNVAVGFGVNFQAVIAGRLSASRWEFGDGMVLSNRPYASHAWSTPGDYAVKLRAYNNSYPGGVAASLVVHVVAQPVHYVALDSATPVAPYTSWATAATNIQAAVDAATVPGGLVLVGDGVYQAGAVPVYGVSNRVAVTKPVTVQSVNGPAVTKIAGFGPIGGAAVRCVYLTNGAVLAGFTLTNGATQASGNSYTNQSGGGVWCESPGAVVTNCILTGNSASGYAGGACYGTLDNCTLTGNSAACGGGTYYGTLNNCTLSGNSASGFGGGVFYGTLNNCTLTGNSANNGGGTCSGTLNNCIVYYNSAPSGINYNSSTFRYSCTTPSPGWPGNIGSEPLFVNTNAWSNLRLQSNSPCINAGTNSYVTWAFDLDGQPRISGGRVDMGAYEYSPLEAFHVWLGQYGLPTGGSADYTDSDHDGLNNWQEWVAGTNPTNAASALWMLTPTDADPGVTVAWTSVTNRTYSLEYSTDLAASAGFSVLRSNLAGLPSTTSYTDTNAATSPRFYRVRVEQ